MEKKQPTSSTKKAPDGYRHLTRAEADAIWRRAFWLAWTSRY